MLNSELTTWADWDFQVLFMLADGKCIPCGLTYICPVSLLSSHTLYMIIQKLVFWTLLCGLGARTAYNDGDDFQWHFIFKLILFYWGKCLFCPVSISFPKLITNFEIFCILVVYLQRARNACRCSHFRAVSQFRRWTRFSSRRWQVTWLLFCFLIEMLISSPKFTPLYLFTLKGTQDSFKLCLDHIEKILRVKAPALQLRSVQRHKPK